jgi:TPR repeat protein
MAEPVEPVATEYAPVVEDFPAQQADPAELAAAMEDLRQGNYADAFPALRAMAAQGDVTAQLQVGALYHQGLGVQQDYLSAALWYRRAAEQGNADAQYSLGNMYLLGEGVDQDDAQAGYWYTQAAAQGHAAAKHNLDNLARVSKAATEPLPIVKGDETASAEAEPAAAADGQPAEKRGFFGRLFGKKSKEQPPGEATPTAEAEPAVTAEAASEPAAESVATAEPAAAEPEAPTEAAEPAPEPVAAAPSRDEQAEQAYRNGIAYSFGDGVPQDHAAAFQWYVRAAELGHAAGQYKVGAAYAYGEGVARDPVQAAIWYRQAALQGYAVAQRNLGSMYANGDGVERNRAMAMAWYSILAEAGNPMDVRRRDMLSGELNAAEQAQAQQLLAELRSELRPDR